MAALLVDLPSLAGRTAADVARSLLVDILLPLVLAGPMLGLFATKVRELANAKHELTILASTDSLTAVLNRGAFQLVVETYLARIDQAPAGNGASMLIVDVDHFKRVNDRLGHDSGDAALRLISRAIRSSLREVDLLGRIGGEEFGVFLPNATIGLAEATAEKVRHSVEAAAFEVDGLLVPLSVSVGGAASCRQIDYEALYRAADQRLYLAKNAGRNSISVLQVAA